MTLRACENHKEEVWERVNTNTGLVDAVAIVRPPIGESFSDVALRLLDLPREAGVMYHIREKSR